MTPTDQRDPDGQEPEGAEEAAASVPIETAPIGAVPLGAVPLGAVPLGAVPTEAAPTEAAPTEAAPIEAVPIEEVIDLHGFQPRDIPSVVEEYLLEAQARGFREVRLIHGRGTGFQRRRVQQLLEQHPLVERFADAPAYRGGWGATLVWLRPLP